MYVCFVYLCNECRGVHWLFSLLVARGGGGGEGKYVCVSHGNVVHMYNEYHIASCDWIHLYIIIHINIHIDVCVPYV